MIYECSGCGRTMFGLSCSQCSPTLAPADGILQDRLTPLDPAFYPEFQYRSKGLILDILGKKKEQTKLNESLNSVLAKYEQLRKPYFTNFIHSTDAHAMIADHVVTPGARAEGDYTQDELFREVLIRKGFVELEEIPTLLEKLLRTTAFNTRYDGFLRELNRHIRPSLRETLRCWIEEAGTTFRQDLALFLYFVWDNEVHHFDISFNEKALDDPAVSLISKGDFAGFMKLCEEIYFDILVERLSIQLEHFNPNQFVTMYMVDAMNGFEFEAFLVKIFQTIGYDVKETSRTRDQGADLFASRFGKTIVIQAKNYSGTVGNSSVQQAISAKAFYGCDEAMVVTNSYFTKSAKELALSASIRLTDRAELQSYLDDYNQKIIEQFQYEDLDID